MADCGTCAKRVAKTAKALACGFCKQWYHMFCAQLADGDYEFMRNRMGLGFRWFCRECIGDIDSAMGSSRTVNQVKDQLSGVVAAIEGLTSRLGDLEAKAGSVGDSSPETFASVIKQTLREVQKPEDLDRRVTDHGQTRVIRNEEVLVLKPRRSEESQASPLPVSLNNLKNTLKSVPVKSCHERRSGNVVMKFPDAGAREEARALVESSADFQDITVSEPKKMLPKMTLLDVPSSLPDSEIIPGRLY